MVTEENRGVFGSWAEFREYWDKVENDHEKNLELMEKLKKESRKKKLNKSGGKNERSLK